jgi:purine-binding chemotaxis protein CheW
MTSGPASGQPGTGQPIDWREVHARLEQTAAATREALRPSAEQAKVVMDERARALARVPHKPPSAAEVVKVAVLSLGTERYALETCYVRRVERLEELTPIPGAPDFLIGVINLRGEILDVFDLRILFGIPVGEVTERSRVVVLGDQRDEFGVLVDAAHEVTTLRLEEVLEPPGSVAGIGRHFLRGVTARTLIVLDGAALLEDSRLFIDQSEDAGT